MIMMIGEMRSLLEVWRSFPYLNFFVLSRSLDRIAAAQRTSEGVVFIPRDNEL